ncbi:diguanylate cyclase [Glaciecola siphonariae]|uniref:diguanylate cyclase n=1 Tax=Glaciecola siphonariae TaxID=521012 RepID=A0ABV9LQ39_9ALTE
MVSLTFVTLAFSKTNRACSALQVNIIAISETVQRQYKADLKTLVKSWSVARRSARKNDLKDFQACLNDTSQNYATYALFALHQMLHSMQLSCARGLAGKDSVKQTTKDLDWLMNQLIRSNNLSPDPFLSEAGTSESFLSKSPAKPWVHSHNPIKVAIVDDEKSVGGALCANLQQFAFEATHYSSMIDFEHSLQNGDPDLVLLDIVMPNVSSEQVFAFAKQLCDRGIKVISCSSLFNYDTRLQAVRAGVSDYAVKPINTYLLVEKITRALRRHIKHTYQIVLLDDQESMGEFYQAVFSQVDVDFHFFNTAESLIAAMEYLQPDLFLLDRVMPSVNGLEVAAMIRQDAKFDFSPIVFLTADEQLDTKLKILSHGADDLIAKTTPAPLVLEQVLARLERAAFIKSFVSKDPLTGVLNHGQIVEAANQQMRLNKRHDNQSVLVLLDVDRFKQVNDTYGHSSGDLVLNGLGQLLLASVRETDYVGRYGGEEFVLLFVNCSVEQALIKTNAIREKCTQMHFVQSKPEIKVSFSGGLVGLEEFSSLPKAISEADRLLYLAKEAGRNQIKVA